VSLRRPAPADLVVDPSALVAVVLAEAAADEVEQALRASAAPIMSAANVVELFLVLEGRLGPAGTDAGQNLLAQADVVVVPVDDTMVDGALRAWRRFGKGHHPAQLNYGDCFAYALAAQWELPLLCVGDDFRHTDLTLAIG